LRIADCGLIEDLRLPDCGSIEDLSDKSAFADQSKIYPDKSAFAHGRSIENLR